MAEIGLVASIIQIVGAGTRLSIAIFDIAATIGNAEKDLQNLGTEVSLLCSVLKQVQGLLEHAHFHPSPVAVESAAKIIIQCRKVFQEMANILAPLNATGATIVFPAADINFVSKVKWAFSRKSRIAMLRSTLESFKLTLSVMLNTMQLAERVSRRRQSSVMTLEEDEHDKAVTQSLLISQQYAVEQLGYWEDKVKEEDLERARSAVAQPMVKKEDNKRRTKLFQRLSGLRLDTDLPSSVQQTDQALGESEEKLSEWLGDMLAPIPEPGEVHPGRLKQKRLSSVGTANAPLELLRKWTDQGGNLNPRNREHLLDTSLNVNPKIFAESFSFESSTGSTRTIDFTEKSMIKTRSPIPRPSVDYLSPRTGRLSSMGSHLIAGVNGSLEIAPDVQHFEEADSYEAIVQSILSDHGSTVSVSQVSLFIAYGGRSKLLKQSDKPLEVLRRYAELSDDLEPRLFIRRLNGKPS